MLLRLRLCPSLSLSVSSYPSKGHLKKRYKTWYVFWWRSPVFVKTKNEHTHMSISILLSPHHQPKIEPVPTYALAPSAPPISISFAHQNQSQTDTTNTACLLVAMPPLKKKNMREAYMWLCPKSEWLACIDSRLHLCLGVCYSKSKRIHPMCAGLGSGSALSTR
jgi:hypothetical protein